MVGAGEREQAAAASRDATGVAAAGGAGAVEAAQGMDVKEDGEEGVGAGETVAESEVRANSVADGDGVIAAGEGGVEARNASLEWVNEFAREGGRAEHGTAMSRALEEALNADEDLSRTELRDFIAAINDGSFAFDSGSIVDADGDLYGPASLEDPISTRPYQFATNNPFLGQTGNRLQPLATACS